MLLTKSKFMDGVQCSKKLWLSVHRKDLKSEPSVSKRYLFWQGQQIGQQAHGQFQGGVLIDAVGFGGALRQTQDAIHNGAPSIFEATFAADGLGCKVDILERREDESWNLIEVKMSTKVKGEHVFDVGLQKTVLEASGLKVARCYLMHVNRDCAYPDLSNLFMREDITELVELASVDLSSKIDDLKPLLESAHMPELAVGKHCDEPFECDFKSFCWKGMPKNSVFTIPRVKSEQLDALLSGNILDVRDLYDYSDLSDLQRSYVELVKSAKPVFETRGVQEYFDRLQYPLYFFDFETDANALPRLDRQRPYQKIPFQYSLHVLTEAGKLSHFGYLHDDLSDPRLPLLEQLLRDLGQGGSIIVYNASFEKSVLAGLAERYPKYARYIESLIERIWDLLDVIKDCVQYPEFAGSNSIKNVLPVLVPTMSYQDLDVASGSDAPAVWNQYIRASKRELKQSLREALLKYCEMDTLAMVEIFRFLQLRMSESERS